jgi:predicted dehydrogenase
MVGILGSGFGLYGYLPAICQVSNERVYLLNKAKKILLSRPELTNYYDRINWVESPSEIISTCNTLIIAYPPEYVYPLIDMIEISSTLRKVIVEKPICQDSTTSIQFITRIKNKKIRIISGFIFVYAEWYQDLVNYNNGDVNIVWKFFKKNNLNSSPTWKYTSSKGGGALKMYGVHLLSVLANLSAVLVRIHQNNDEVFRAVFKTKNNFCINVNIELTNTQSSFIIENITSLETPFGKQKENYQEDFRVKYITKMLVDFENNYDYLDQLMVDTMFLWSITENKTTN